MTENEAAMSALPVVAWRWKNLKTGAQGAYWEDPAQFMSIVPAADYEWAAVTDHAAAEARIAALEAEREALRKDAERLDHIEKNARCDPKMDGKHVWWPTTFKHQLAGPTLRAAIDAALASKGAL